MSFATGHAAQSQGQSFDDQAFRGQENYFMSPFFGGVDNGLDYLRNGPESIQVKAENGDGNLSGEANVGVPFPEAGYTTPLSSVSPVEGSSQQLQNEELNYAEHIGQEGITANGTSEGSLEKSGQSESKDTDDEKHRKRALNRAAQKAFRERKEARMRELEEKLKQSEQGRQELLREVENLRKHNIEIHAENRILLQTQGSKTPSVADPSVAKFVFPTKRDFVGEMVPMHPDFLSELPASEQYLIDGKQMLTVSAAWEYLHRLSESFDFDVSMVMANLKGKEMCHGKGPSYMRSDIDRFLSEAKRFS